jgi:hypothetical protein
MSATALLEMRRSTARTVYGVLPGDDFVSGQLACWRALCAMSFMLSPRRRGTAANITQHGEVSAWSSKRSLVFG